MSATGKSAHEWDPQLHAQCPEHVFLGAGVGLLQQLTEKSAFALL